MLIIGLDPSLSCTGWGIIAKSGNRLSHVANGQIKTDSKAPLPDRLVQIDRELEKALGEAAAVKLAWKPGLKVEVNASDAATLLKLIDILDDDDDVQTVWGNYEISDEVMEQLG